MNDEELLKLQDAIGDSLRTFAGVEQALGHVGDESTDYPMCQMLSGVIHSAIQDVFGALPEEWEREKFLF